MSDSNSRTIEQRIEVLEATVRRLSKPTTIRFVYPGGKAGVMVPLDDTGTHAYCPVGEREISMRTVVILLLNKLGLSLDVKHAEPERLTLK